MSNICICGGGSLGHVCAGFLAAGGNCVNVYTKHPQKWTDTIEVTDIDGRLFKGALSAVSDRPEDVVPGMDIVFLCLPGYLIESTLNEIKAFVGDAVTGSVVSSTGFFTFAHKVLGEQARLFGFQRTPFIARVGEYGRTANLLGYKKEVAIAVENVPDREAFRGLVERLFRTPARLLGSRYEASLTNSNPILHTGRLYCMFSGWDGTPFKDKILFYKEWTVDSSDILIRMDREFMELVHRLAGPDAEVTPLLEYYESHDSESLTAKISSIPAFQTIESPMKRVEGGWAPDFRSRYFTEDFPFGLRFLCDMCHAEGIACPTMDAVCEWGMKVSECDR